MTTTLVRRCVSMFFMEAGLWAGIDWFKRGSGNNEDTFINNLVKPLLSAAFGRLAGCTFRWSRDPLRSGKRKDPDARLLLPDYQVSFGARSIFLAEFKTAVASRKEMENDFIKLTCMGKKAVDALYKDGFHASVVLMHGKGVDIEVFELRLRAEAVYFLQCLGKFQLVTNPQEFPLLLCLGPLISAQVRKK
ncbi:hypothetical protein BGZ80_009494 [Entomortierella chlamydospora]|uniref:Uncharacterized protein n=1 Tax=Entomortierella chlamydospora TaxID=101097 RepID=A0A9P6T0P8_9FUNG|nr:hypothetical protein BGZ79_008040 [Entomortierella chlamydospora]KAG0016005.1 hypothetical protein BGZ80_009494 [Entomortierella chlamydospora]